MDEDKFFRALAMHAVVTRPMLEDPMGGFGYYEALFKAAASCSAGFEQTPPAASLGPETKEQSLESCSSGN
jgi:hypothetical protein